MCLWLCLLSLLSYELQSYGTWFFTATYQPCSNKQILWKVCLLWFQLEAQQLPSNEPLLLKEFCNVLLHQDLMYHNVVLRGHRVNQIDDNKRAIVGFRWAGILCSDNGGHKLPAHRELPEHLAVAACPLTGNWLNTYNDTTM